MKIKIGIISGSGLDEPKLLQDYEEVEADTPYGTPSSAITCGKIAGIEVCIIARHGKNHEIPPTQVNNRANIYALKGLGCTHVIATTAVGSLREEIGRGDFVVCDQFIDFTKRRKLSFYEEFKNGPKHATMAEPFSEELRRKIIVACHEQGIKVHPRGTVVTIEGPRFSTRAESSMFRQFGADVINMSIAPEAILANEAGMKYAAIAMSTDYDCWRTDEAPVTWEQILKIFSQNAEKMKKLLARVVEKIAEGEAEKTGVKKFEVKGLAELKKESEDSRFIKSRIRTIPNWPKPGIMFRDITTLLKDAEGFERVVKIFEERYKSKEIDLVAGIESRGFIIASALATRLKKGVIPVRKPGKLPAETIREDYLLEYGTDAVEIHKDAILPGQKILLCDDLIATGGTAAATGNLIEKLGGQIIECCFIIELPELNGRAKLRWPVFKIVDFEGR